MEAIHRVRVDLIQVKGPGCIGWCTNERYEEITEDLGFLVVRCEVMTVPSESKDFVLSKALRGRHVEEFRVFSPINGPGNLGTPTPVRHFLMDRAFEK